MKTENEKERTVCKYCGEEISNKYGSGVDGFPGGWSIVLEGGKWLSPWCPDAPEGKDRHEPMGDKPIEDQLVPRTESIPEEAYFDRNQAVQVIAKLAYQLGYKCGVKEDKEWPILYVDLPSGQVSWHIPANEMIGAFPEYDDGWDGHDVEEKRERLRKFIMGE